MRHGKDKYLPKVTEKLEAEQGLNFGSPDPLTLSRMGQQVNSTSTRGRATMILVFIQFPKAHKEIQSFIQEALSEYLDGTRDSWGH